MIKPIKKEEIPKGACSGRRIRDIIDFLESGYPSAEVFDDKAKDAKTVAGGLYAAINRKGFSAKVIRIEDRVFLIRKEKCADDASN